MAAAESAASSLMTRLAGLRARWAARLVGLAVMLGELLVRRFARDTRTAFLATGNYPWTARLETQWHAVREELDVVLQHSDQIPNFQDISSPQRAITDDDRWKVFVFSIFGSAVADNCARCPRTARLLSEIPGLQNAMFSILSPHKHIPPHRGPYAGLLRYHLGLKIPRSTDTCAIWVDGVEKHWQEGHSMVFDDSYPHWVRNDTAEQRVVLFADFERPLPALLRPFNRMVIALLARSPLGREPVERLRDGHNR